MDYIVAHQAPLSMKFSRQEYWSSLPFPSPGDLPNPGIKPRIPALQADSLPYEPQGKALIKFGGHLLFFLEKARTFLIFIVNKKPTLGNCILFKVITEV